MRLVDQARHLGHQVMAVVQRGQAVTQRHFLTSRAALPTGRTARAASSRLPRRAANSSATTGFVVTKSLAPARRMSTRRATLSIDDNARIGSSPLRSRLPAHGADHREAGLQAFEHEIGDDDLVVLARQRGDGLLRRAKARDH